MNRFGNVSFFCGVVMVLFFLSCGGGEDDANDDVVIDPVEYEGEIKGYVFFPAYISYSDWKENMRRCALQVTGQCDGRGYARSVDYTISDLLLCDEGYCEYTYGSSRWDKDPEYSGDQNESILVTLYDSSYEFVDDILTSSDGYYNFSKLPDGYYFLNAYCERLSESDPDETIDTFEAWSVIIEVSEEGPEGLFPLKDLYQVYITSIPKSEGIMNEVFW